MRKNGNWKTKDRADGRTDIGQEEMKAGLTFEKKETKRFVQMG